MLFGCDVERALINRMTSGMPTRFPISRTPSSPATGRRSKPSSRPARAKRHAAE